MNPIRKRLTAAVICIAMAVCVVLAGCSGQGPADDNTQPQSELQTGEYTPGYPDIEYVPLTEEEFNQVCAENAAQSEAIAAMPGYSKDDTWAFYIYMVGSNLESSGLDELSDLSKILVEQENEEYTAQKDENIADTLLKFSDDLQANGADLPKKLYNPVTTHSQAEDSPAPSVDSLGAASFNIEQMLNAEYGDNVKVVFQTGGAKRWQNVVVNPNRSQRFLIDKNGFAEVYNEPLTRMSTPDALADFLKFCTDNFNADHKVVVLWNHGGGVSGYGMDEIYADAGLSVPEIRTAFEKAFGTAGAEPALEAVGFDACLMASTEVADYLSGYAKYLYASEELEPGKGWNYKSIIETVSQNPEINGAQLGKAVADSFLWFNCEDFAATKTYDSLSFSVTDLSKAPAVYSAYADFAAAALKNVAEDPAELAVISRALSRSIAYGMHAFESINTFDLGMFMASLPEKYANEAAAVLKALDEAVLYSRTSYILEGSCGLSIFYPQYIAGVKGLYSSLKFIQEVSRSQDINALYYYKLAGCLNDENKQYLASKGLTVPDTINFKWLEMLSQADVTEYEGGNFSLTMDEEMIDITQDVRLGLASFDEATGDVIYFGEDACATLEEDGTVNTNFSGKWASLDGIPLALKIVSVSPENIIYSSPILYQDMDAYLLLSYSFNDQKTSFMGICLESDLAVPGRKVYGIAPGDEITIVRDHTNVNSLAQDSDYQTITITETTDLDEMQLADGVYLAYVTALDLRGDVYYSKVTRITISGGQVTDQYLDTSMMGYDKD